MKLQVWVEIEPCAHGTRYRATCIAVQTLTGRKCYWPDRPLHKGVMLLLHTFFALFHCLVVSYLSREMKLLIGTCTYMNNVRATVGRTDSTVFVTKHQALSVQQTVQPEQSRKLQHSVTLCVCGRLTLGHAHKVLAFTCVCWPYTHQSCIHLRVGGHIHLLDVTVLGEA